jgi:hypothetical protein
MPYKWKVDPAARLVFVRGWGPMDLEESLRTPHELLSDPAYDPGFGVLVDLRELDYEPQPDDVVAVAHNLIGMAPLLRSRIGVVVAQGLATAAEVGAAMAGAGGLPLRVFTDPDEARAWLAGDTPDDE